MTVPSFSAKPSAGKITSALAFEELRNRSIETTKSAAASAFLAPVASGVSATGSAPMRSRARIDPSSMCLVGFPGAVGSSPQCSDNAPGDVTDTRPGKRLGANPISNAP